HYVKVSLATTEKWVNKYGKKGKLSSEFSKEKTPTGFSGFITLDGTFKSMKTKKKRPKSGIIKRGLLLAYDPIQKKSLAGAIVRVEDEEETAYFLQALKDWVPLPINYITIDFSKRLEAGVKQHFNETQILKCAFHAPQLLNRGILKELVKIKKDTLLAHIKEWNLIRARTIKIEKKNGQIRQPEFKFIDTKTAWQVYMKLRSIFSYKNFRKIKANFERFISSIPFKNWKGSEFFIVMCNNLFSKFSWSQKSIKYIEPKVYKAWRAVIREFRRNIESLKKS
ncbi:unnamed protein product, partial [marine sediment metagenome]